MEIMEKETRRFKFLSIGVRIDRLTVNTEVWPCNEVVVPLCKAIDHFLVTVLKADDCCYNQ